MKVLFFILFVSSFMLKGCSQNAVVVNATEFEKGLNQKNIQLLDVRTAEEYNKGHIKNALQANWNNTDEFKSRTIFLDKEKPVYIYCQAGGRSSAAHNWLKQNGFKNIVELKGGMINWLKEKKPTDALQESTQLTLTDFETLINKPNEIFLVDFGATWCPPCVKLKPVLDSLQTEYKGKFTFIPIDAGVHINLMKELSVESLPTILIYKNNKVLMRSEGLATKEDFIKWMGL